MIISITESFERPFQALEAFWELLKEVQDELLPEDEAKDRPQCTVTSSPPSLGSRDC